MLSKAVLDNLFHGARQAAFDLLPGLWFMCKRVDADVPYSSQALALDVFGTLKYAKSRDRVCNLMASLLEVPPGGPWEVLLEFEDPDNLLHEMQHKSQIDVLLKGAKSLIALECKFAETRLEPCSQIGKTGKGVVQCNGNYELQVNPANGRTSFCALSGKGIRYWEHIPRIFQFPADQAHRPCPFARDWYQWMRTLVMADALAEKRGLRPAAGLVYVDRPTMPLYNRIRTASDEMTARLTGAAKCELLRFEKLPGMFETAAENSEEEALFRSLRHWVTAKVNWVEARLSNARAARQPPRSKRC